MVYFSVFCLVLVLDIIPLQDTTGQQCLNKDCDDRLRGVGSLREFPDLSTDFEDGWLNTNWIDESQGGVKWNVEDFTNSTSWEFTDPPASPDDGRKYIRVHRGTTLSFSVAVLRSQQFTLPSYDVEISFSFWIRSKWQKFNNLELYLSENGSEKLLLSLSEYSETTNMKWRTSPVISLANYTSDPFSNKLSLVFYAYCGKNVEDAVAIDNIRYTPTTPDPTTPDPTTPDPTTPDPTTSDPPPSNEEWQCYSCLSTPGEFDSDCYYGNSTARTETCPKQKSCYTEVTNHYDGTFSVLRGCQDENGEIKTKDFPWPFYNSSCSFESLCNSQTPHIPSEIECYSCSSTTNDYDFDCDNGNSNVPTTKCEGSCMTTIVTTGQEKSVTRGCYEYSLSSPNKQCTFCENSKCNAGTGGETSCPYCFECPSVPPIPTTSPL